MFLSDSEAPDARAPRKIDCSAEAIAIAALDSQILHAALH
jgi:hypothetical protein